MHENEPQPFLKSVKNKASIDLTLPGWMPEKFSGLFYPQEMTSKHVKS